MFDALSLSFLPLFPSLLFSHCCTAWFLHVVQNEMWRGKEGKRLRKLLSASPSGVCATSQHPTHVYAHTDKHTRNYYSLLSSILHLGIVAQLCTTEFVVLPFVSLLFSVLSRERCKRRRAEWGYELNLNQQLKWCFFHLSNAIFQEKAVLSVTCNHKWVFLGGQGHNLFEYRKDNLNEEPKGWIRN